MRSACDHYNLSPKSKKHGMTDLLRHCGLEVVIDSPGCYKHQSEPQKGHLPCCSREPNVAPCGPSQEAKEKMEQLEGALQNTETGQDLCTSRKLQRQHGQLENKSQALASKMADLISQAHSVATAQTILEETQQCCQRCLFRLHSVVSLPLYRT
jgi:hypothetical protein